ncbi:MAG: PilN domain-containing protein [Nitrosomonas sp.]|nr:PilN domain-containing protein [Nitrosomonas sp.]
MIHINLLPHRELKRKARQQQFGVLASLTVVLGILIIWTVHEMALEKIAQQQARNQYLQNEITLLDQQIAEIKLIKEKIQQLISRKQIVESLQIDRVKVVHMLDQVVRRIPDGVHLKSFKQTEQHLHLSGYAQSNAWVSTLMRNLDASPWFESPLLIEIKAVTIDGKRLNEFDLNIRFSDVPKNGDQTEIVTITGEAGEQL